jgi:uncharacterized peroxidase-related enzyme
VAWTRSVAPEEAPPAVREVYEQIRSRSAAARVAGYWQAQGLDPAGLAAAWAADRSLRERATRGAAEGGLGEAGYELLAVAISATNGCGYCVAHHGPKLARALGDEALARAVARDYREADLAARDRVLLDYAVALTCEPSERTRDDLERMREYGFDDAAILLATQVTAHFNAVNRVVSALGIELEPGVEAWETGAPA